MLAGYDRVLLSFSQYTCLSFHQGADHLTVTWKVDEGVYQHVDVREEGKENAFSLGRSLWIDSEVRLGNPSDMSVKVYLFDLIAVHNSLPRRGS